MPKMSKYHIYNLFPTVPILGFGILLSLLAGKLHTPTKLRYLATVTKTFIDPNGTKNAKAYTQFNAILLLSDFG